MKTVFLYILTAALFLSCAASKSNQNQTNKVASQSKKTLYEHVMIGQGGGFSGEYETFKISSTGEIYKLEETDGSFSKTGSLDAGQTKSLFKDLKALELEKMELHQPGNISFYIQIPVEGGVKKITWSEEIEVNENLTTFYDIYWAHIKAPN